MSAILSSIHFNFPIIHVEKLWKFVGKKVWEPSIIKIHCEWFWVRASAKRLNVSGCFGAKRRSCNFVNNTDLPCLGMRGPILSLN